MAAVPKARRYFENVVLQYEGNECLTWPYAKNASGYGRLVHRGKLWLVPRLVCEAVYGPPPTPEHQAAHSCGRGKYGCCTKRHLSWKSPRENMLDRIDHGTLKLNPSDAFIIRSLAPFVSNKLLAKRFGVTPAAISLVATGKHWSWVTEAELDAALCRQIPQTLPPVESVGPNSTGDA